MTKLNRVHRLHDQQRTAVAAIAIVVAAGAASTASAQYREYDGSNNNLANTSWGAAHTQLRRESPNAYGDGVWTMGRQSISGPREISNAVSAQSGAILNNRFLSDMAWQWGQFLDHDFDHTPPAGVEVENISTPGGDPHFLGAPISFSRSTFDPLTGDLPGNPRQQTNELTAYLDGSNVYGSDSVRAAALRSGVGGRMATSAGDLLPFNTFGLDNDNGPMGGPASDFFVAGDIRANEQAGLTAMHTLWVREHNRLADAIATANPALNDEEIYQRARAVVGAKMQAITYNEWLPAMFGDILPNYSGYDNSVDATISNEFSTAAFRLGHTMLSPDIQRLDNSGNPIPDGHLALRDAFFNPDNISDYGIEPYLKGLANGQAQEIDTKIVDDVRNFLFGPPGAGGFDLAALNIQRGRDHGIADYNTVRQAYGLAPVASFSDISSDPATQAALASVYANPNEIDPWVGLLAEDHVPGGSFGETIVAIMADQFGRLRDGDRFFYLNGDDPAGLNSILAELGMTIDDIDDCTLADVILANTSLTNIQGNVFFIPAPGAIALFSLAGLAAARRRRNA
ncbi:MAG: peroxidase family protein [Planctomycetota bacterium]|nr:peroxidase family protein [Planctomycetota bacterium]